MTTAMPWGDPLAPDLDAGTLAGLAPAARRAQALAEAEALAGAAPDALALVNAMISALETRGADAPTWVRDRAVLSPQGDHLLDQLLGTGEVLGRIDELDGSRITITEAVLTGVWSLRRTDAVGQPRDRWIEIGPVPTVVTETRPAYTVAALKAAPPPPPGTMAVRPLLSEIAAHAEQDPPPGSPNHVINLSLMPLTEADVKHLGATLGRGPVALRVRGHGASLIQATAIERVWSVRYLNASGTIVLDSLEVGRVPVAVCATPEDFADSAVRLTEIRNAYL